MVIIQTEIYGSRKRNKSWEGSNNLKCKGKHFQSCREAQVFTLKDSPQEIDLIEQQ